jgi:hypothetical protein
MSSLMIGYFSFLFPNQMFGRGQEAAKETLRRRITVMLCLNEIPQINQEGGGGVTATALVPVGFWTHFEDNLNRCLSSLDICFMPQAGLSFIACKMVFLSLLVFGIRIRISRIRMFLGLPDLLVRGTGSGSFPFLIKVSSGLK